MVTHQLIPYACTALLYNMSLNCEYSSQEYQVVLQPDILMNSFENGVMQVISELAKIEKNNIMNFKVSKSSLAFKNVSLARYTIDNSRDLSDFYLKPVFKSRRNKPTKPADIVMKFSAEDPELVCIQLTTSKQGGKSGSPRSPIP
ncbi:unnamed protein product [Rotaria magnacalcarata]